MLPEFFTDHPELLVGFAIIIPITTFLPIMIAAVRRLEDRRKIAALNLAGLVFLTPWFIALSWAVFGKRNESYYERIKGKVGYISALLIGVIILFACIFWFFLLPSLSQAFEDDEPIKVTSAIVDEPTILGAGEIEPLLVTPVSSEVSGRVIEVLATEGMEVSAGQQLLKLDRTPFQLAVERAEADANRTRALLTASEASISRQKAALGLAERALERGTFLLEQGFATRSFVEQLEDDVTAASGALIEARASRDSLVAELQSLEAVKKSALFSLDRTLIRAPIGGVVLKQNVEIGQTVVSSFEAATLFEIAPRIDELVIRAEFNENDVIHIEPDDVASVRLTPYPDERFKARVVRRSNAPVSTGTVRMYEVILSIEVSDKTILPGMSALVEIEVD